MSEKPKLTAKQQAFVREYLIDLNATQAAVRASYSEDSAGSIGHELLKKPEIQAAIQEAMDERADRTRIDADYVLSSLRVVAERCMERAPVMVQRGREWVQKQDEEGRDVWEFNAAGANKALELLGKHLKLFTEKHEHSGKLGIEQLVAGSKTEESEDNDE